MSGDGTEIGEAHAALADAGAFDARARAQTLILGLGFQVNELENPVNSFSGGWRMRLQLARALMCPADLLLLDEPTNHLDLDALVWLEAWLQRFEGTLLVISHDREFLDAVTRVTVHLDQSKLTRYGGNYSTFEDVRSQQLTVQQAAFEKQQDRIAHLQSFISRFKAKATKAKQAQSRVKALERMEKIAPVITSADFTFEFKTPQDLPNPMLTIRDAVVGYTDAAGQTTPIVRNITRSVVAGQRIGLLGANGQGKSTLVKTIARAIKALSGEFREGKGLSIGYFAQHQAEELNPDNEVLAEVEEVLHDNPDANPRAALGALLFSGNDVFKKTSVLSGGERNRVALAKLLMKPCNFLIMDEPTNHLDIRSKEVLQEALNLFDGTALIVSHDRSFLDSVVTKVLEVSPNKTRMLTCNVSEYMERLKTEEV